MATSVGTVRGSLNHIVKNQNVTVKGFGPNELWWLSLQCDEFPLESLVGQHSLFCAIVNSLKTEDSSYVKAYMTQNSG